MVVVVVSIIGATADLARRCIEGFDLTAVMFAAVIPKAEFPPPCGVGALPANVAVDPLAGSAASALSPDSCRGGGGGGIIMLRVLKWRVNADRARPKTPLSCLDLTGAADEADADTGADGAERIAPFKSDDDDTWRGRSRVVGRCLPGGSSVVLRGGLERRDEERAIAAAGGSVVAIVDVICLMVSGESTRGKLLLRLPLASRDSITCPYMHLRVQCDG